MKSGLYGPNEVGAAICKKTNGEIVLGPITEGTPDSVRVILECPTGSVFDGIFHTHPGSGITKPSQQDILTGIWSGSKKLCIFSEGDMECHGIG